MSSMFRAGLLSLVVGCTSSGLGLQDVHELEAQEGREDSYRAAQRSTGVPADLLFAVAMAETGDESIVGEEEFEGQPPAFGAMALRGEHLELASDLLGDRLDDVKSDRARNILAAATLLSHWADELAIDRSNLDDWAAVIARYSGIEDPEARKEYVWDVYDNLASGEKSNNYEGMRHETVPNFEVPAKLLHRDADDSDVVWSASPNFSSRGSSDVEYLVIHTCEGSYAGCWGWLVNPSAGVSAHYVVKEDGSEVRQLVEEDDKAWHIGAKYYCENNDGVDCDNDGTSSNNLSVGIEHAGYAGQSSWSPELIDRSVELACGIVERHDIPVDANHIVGHGQLQPYNRTDPGPAWPWDAYIEGIADCVDGEVEAAVGLELDGLSGDSGSEASWTVEVPAGATELLVEMRGGSGDADLYVNHGSVGTNADFDCRPYVGGNDETCRIANPAAGTWHVTARGYSAFAGVSLTAEIAAASDEEPVEGDLLDLADLSGAAGGETTATIEVHEGARSLVVSMSGGTGDADLYLRHGSEPTKGAFDCRPYLGGNEESCLFEFPAPGTWHVMVRGYSAFSGVDVLGSVE